MNKWYVAIILFNFVIAWWVSHQYYLRCHSTTRRPNEHGALEFNLTAFGLNFLVLWFAAINRPDSWLFGVIGGILIFIVVRRFWVNWERSSDA